MEKKKPPKCTLTFVPLLLQAPQKVFAIVTPVEAFICMNLKFQSNINIYKATSTFTYKK